MRLGWGIVIALGTCALAGGSGVVASRAIDNRRTQSILAEGERRASLAQREARENIDRQLSATELMALNAANNPRLLAALEGGVDNETLRDIFLTESWWARYREAFESYGVAKGDAITTIEGSPLATPNALALVRAARRKNGTASALVATERGPYIAAATTISLVTRASPILMVARHLDQEFGRLLVERTGAALAISDGVRTMLIAGDATALRAFRDAARAPLGNTTVRHPSSTETTSIDAIGSGLWLLTYSDLKALEVAAAAADARRKVFLWGMEAALSLAIFFVLWRSSRRHATAKSRHPGAYSASLLPPGATVSVHGLLGDGRGASDARRLPAPDVDESAIAPRGGAVRVGHYLLLEQIGEGGMAQIFTAIRTATGGFRRTVVVKRLRPELSANAEAVSQFIDEANLASQLVHSNIVPVFDSGKISGQYYIAQEYIVGRDLGRVLARLHERGKSGLPLQAVLFVAHEVLQALDYAHNKRAADGRAAGIVHRDVTPENVMVSARGEVKLLDFGIVKATEGRVTKTQLGMVKGSIGFMSPEQARGREVDHRSDLFSVGLLIFTLHAGHCLYQGATTYDLMVRAASGPGVPELEEIARLPTPLPQLLLHALAIAPDERFQSAAEFAATLAPFVGDGAHQLADLLKQEFNAELQTEERRASVTNVPVGVDEMDGTPAPVIVDPPARA